MDESRSTGERLLTGYFDQFTIEHLHRYALAQELVSGLDVLDIACGEGYGSHLLTSRARSVVGVDIDNEVVRHAREKYAKDNLRFLQGSASSIPLESASLDVVVSFETLEHHDQHEEMMREVKRVLRPSGVLIISTPDKANFSDDTGHRNAYHVKELYKEEFFELVERYFRQVARYSQKLAFGSLLQPAVGQAIPAHSLEIFSGTHAQVSCSQAISKPMYHLAIASDASVKPLPLSLFDGQIVLDRWMVESERAGYLDQRVRGLTTELEQLRNSRTYRLGAWLLAPFRKSLGRG